MRFNGLLERLPCAASTLLTAPRNKGAFNAAVRNQPDESDTSVNSIGNPWVDERERHGYEVAEGRKLSLPVLSDCGRQQRVRSLMGDDSALQNGIGDCRHQQDKPVDGTGGWRADIFAYPGGSEWKQRQPEQQMQIRPQNSAADRVRGLEHMMMIAPINADIDEAQDIAQEDGRQCRQVDDAARMRRWLQFQHHDGNRHGDDAIAERFKSILFHAAMLMEVGFF
jgi:hypothetical protein